MAPPMPSCFCAPFAKGITPNYGEPVAEVLATWLRPHHHPPTSPRAIHSEFVTNDPKESISGFSSPSFFFRCMVPFYPHLLPILTSLSAKKPSIFFPSFLHLYPGLHIVHFEHIVTFFSFTLHGLRSTQNHHCIYLIEQECDFPSPPVGLALQSLIALLQAVHQFIAIFFSPMAKSLNLVALPTPVSIAGKMWETP